MSKAADMAKISAKGSFHLMWGLVISTVISAGGVILIARLLAPAEYGIYTIALTVPNLIGVFRDWGISSAMIKYSAQYKAEESYDKVRSILVAGLVFETVVGIALFILSFLISGFLATTVFNRPQITGLLQISSTIVLTGTLLTAAQGTFTGIERMELNSVLLVVQSILKISLIAGLVIIGFGAFGAVTGYAITSLLAGLTSILLLRMVYKLYRITPNYKLEIISHVKTLLKFGLPLSAFTIIGSLLPQFYNLLLPIFASDTLVGNFSVANNFVVLITFFVTPITTVMFPAFSKLDGKTEQTTLKNVYRFSVKYASLLVIPVAFLVLALAQPAVSILFGGQYVYAPLFLALLALGYLGTATGSLSNSNLINGQGHTKFMLKIAILVAAVGFPASILMTWRFGLVGLIVAMDTIGLPATVTELYWINKNYKITVDFKASLKIILSSATAAAVTFAFVYITSFSSILKLLAGFAIFVSVLLPLILVLKTLTRMDILNLREMTKAVPYIGRIFDFGLTIIEKIVNHFEKPEQE